MTKQFTLKSAGLVVAASIASGCTSPLFQFYQPPQVQEKPIDAPIADPPIRVEPTAVLNASSAEAEPVIEVAVTQEEIDRQRRAEARAERIEERKRDRDRSQSDSRDDDDDDDRDGGWTPGG